MNSILNICLGEFYVTQVRFKIHTNNRCPLLIPFAVQMNSSLNFTRLVTFYVFRTAHLILQGNIFSPCFMALILPKNLNIVLKICPNSSEQNSSTHTVYGFSSAFLWLSSYRATYCISSYCHTEQWCGVVQSWSVNELFANVGAYSWSKDTLRKAVQLKANKN